LSDVWPIAVSEAAPRAMVLGKIRDRNRKRAGQLVEHRNGWILEPSLQAAHKGTVNLGVYGELLLREAPLDAMPPKIPSKESPSIHAGEAIISLFI
jgi:hypothetical protein